MNKKNILELREYILNKILNFCKYYENENILETDFLSWNIRDVVGHINSWIKYSVDKLEAIKINKSFEYNNVDINIFNKNNYENYRDKSLEYVLNESKIVLEKYKNILDLYNEEELLSKEFPTGFSFCLWKYMAMDLGIHPLMHILHYYLKRSDYHEFIKEIENSNKYFMEYSDKNINEYNFNDYFGNIDEKRKAFKELEKINGNLFIGEIIRVNLMD